MNSRLLTRINNFSSFEQKEEKWGEGESCPWLKANILHMTQHKIFCDDPTDNSGTDQFSSASSSVIKEENLIFCASSFPY